MQIDIKNEATGTHDLKTPHVVFLPVVFLSSDLVHGQGSQISMERPD